MCLLDDHKLTDEDVYHDINDVGPTEGIAVKQLWYHIQSLYQNDSQKLFQEFEVHFKYTNNVYVRLYMNSNSI